jgi:ribosomal protein S18 acetylase RimI-like enzyme
VSVPGRGVVYRSRGADGLAPTRDFVERVVSRDYGPGASDFARAEAASSTAAFDPERDILLTAEREERLAGVLIITRVDPGAARFNWLIVDGAERNGGIGRELLFRGIDMCRERRLFVLRARSFASSPAGPHLYWLYGFRVVDLIPVAVGEGTRESILFEKRLDPPADSPEI